MYVLISNHCVHNTLPMMVWNAGLGAFQLDIGSGYVDSGRGQGTTGNYSPPAFQHINFRQNHVRDVPAQRDPIHLFSTLAVQAAIGWIGTMGYFWPPGNLSIGVWQENIGAGTLDWRDPLITFPLRGGTYVTGDYVREFWAGQATIVADWQRWMGE